MGWNIKGDFQVRSYRNVDPPRESPYPPNTASTMAWEGSLVVFTKIDTASIGAVPTVRPLLGADVTALYQDGASNVCGVLGILENGFYTDSSGAAINTIPESSIKSARGTAVEPVPSYAATRQPTTWTYNGTIYTYDTARILYFDDNLEVWGNLKAGQLAGDASIIGDLIGFSVDPGTGATNRTIRHAVTVDTAATTKIGWVSNFDPNDNTKVAFKINRAFQQHFTRFIYSAQ